MNKNKFGKVVLEYWRKLQVKCKRWYYGRVNQLWETFCHIRSYQILLAIAYLRKGKGICQFDKKICMIGWLRKIIRINKLQNRRIFSWRDSPFSLHKQWIFRRLNTKSKSKNLGTRFVEEFLIQTFILQFISHLNRGFVLKHLFFVSVHSRIWLPWYFFSSFSILFSWAWILFSRSLA